MNFNINKLYSLKNKKSIIDLTQQEIDFMSNIFYSVLNSEDYDEKIKYLAGIYEYSISDIKLIIDIYLLHYADKEDKKNYNEKLKIIQLENTKNGFANFGIVLVSTMFIIFSGFVFAILLYR